MWIHFSCDVFVAVSCRGILNSLLFTKAWSMKAWIPVVSSSLYFWKSVFSFRADSILKSDGDFISNWKFPDCVHFFGAWARQAVIESIGTLRTRTRRILKTPKPKRARGKNAVTSAGKTKLRMRTRRQRQSCANPLNSAKHIFVL